MTSIAPRAPLARLSRLALITLLAALGSGCGLSRTTEPTPPEPPTHPQPQEIAAAIEDALVLDLVPTTPLELTRGASMGFTWTLRNTSGNDPIPVVQGGDGSEVAWREPHLTYELERLGESGEWEAMPRPLYGRCGLFDPNWQDDVVELAPGDALAIEWAPYLAPFAEPGRYRVTAEYRYTGGTTGRGDHEGEIEHGAMEGMPPFTVRSAPVEVTIVEE